jgi:hypothetical protein
MAHLERQAGRDPALRDRLAAAIQRRHSELRDTAGLNEEVFDALIILAAGSFEPDDIRGGHRKVISLAKEMDQGRQHRLLRLGFDRTQAQELSSLHTRNFM